MVRDYCASIFNGEQEIKKPPAFASGNSLLSHACRSLLPPLDPEHLAMLPFAASVRQALVVERPADRPSAEA